MLTIQKPIIYDRKAYIYGSAAMILCSVGAVSTIAWGSSWKEHSWDVAVSKHDSVVRNATDKEREKKNDSPAETPVPVNTTENKTTPEVSNDSPAVRSVQSSTPPAPATPVPAPTPKPTPAPTATPSPSPTPEPTPDPLDPFATLPSGQ